jgi:hypothetical protein
MNVGASKDWVQEMYIREYVKPKLQSTDFYWENGKMVMTEFYHKKRGSCCGSGCLHCPYNPKHQKGSTTLKESL